MSQSPELGGFKCFLAVAEELHFGRAAARLNMTQPTISQHVRRLEASLGVSLFKRSTRVVELTASGEALVSRAQEIFSKVEEAVLLSKLAAGGMSAGGEKLSVGAIDPAAHRLLPALLRRFRNRFPKTRLDVRIYDSTALVRALERDECHVGVMRPPSSGNLLKFRPLATQHFVAVIPRGSTLANRPMLKLADFRNHKVFTLNRFELSSFEAVFKQIVEAGIEVDGTVEVSNTAAALALASAGVGATFLPEWIESIADNNVVLRRVEDLNLEISIGIGWRNDSPIPGILPFVECAALISDLASAGGSRGNLDEFAYLRSSSSQKIDTELKSIAAFPN